MSGVEYRSRNKLLLMKVEATSGTEETPTVGADAIQAGGLGFNPNFEFETPDEHTGGLDAAQGIIGGGSAGVPFNIVMRGSGAAGTAPEYDAAMQGCGFAVTTTAAAVTGTAQAGAASNITLAAGESATNDIYKGMVMRLTAGTASGESNVITAYDGTTKIATVASAWTVQPDATSEYSIDANVLYRPASVGLKTVTAHVYQHASAGGGLSWYGKLVGAVGTMNLEIGNAAAGHMNFDFTGILPAAPANAAHPGAATFDDVKGESLRSADITLGGAKLQFNRFTVDLGNEVSQADDPSAEFGFGVAGIMGRNVTGTFNPNLAALATRNNLAAMMAQTDQTLVVRWGSVAGRRLSLMFPAVRISNTNMTDTNGAAAEEVAFQALGVDDTVYICVH